MAKAKSKTPTAGKKPARRARTQKASRAASAAAVAADLPFDPSIYSRPPRLDVPAAIALAAQLIAAALKRPTEVVKRSLDEVKTAHDQLNALWIKRNRVAKASDPRPIDNRADSAWATFFDRLENYTRLPVDEYPLAARAAELCTLLFPERVAFIHYDYPSQWAEMNKILNIIDTDKLAPELDKLVGPDFLAFVRKVHGPYGKMVGATERKEAVPAAENLLAPLGRLTDAIGSYCLQLSALHQDRASNAATRTAVRAALKPVDDVRASQLSRKGPGPGSTGGEESPTPPSDSSTSGNAQPDTRPAAKK